jgi:alpha-tubulin suppressor-like RCC1 family protein
VQGGGAGPCQDRPGESKAQKTRQPTASVPLYWRRVDVYGASFWQASIGGWHCLCLTDQGNVYAFGGNEYNQCALQRDSRERAERDVCVPTQILPSLKVRQVAAGGMHSVALTMEGEVRSLLRLHVSCTPNDSR